MAYDEKCYELAEYFLPQPSDDAAGRRISMAQAIQTAVEDWLESDEFTDHRGVERGRG